MATKTIFFTIGFDVMQGEALALFHALSWVVDSGLPFVVDR